MGNTTTDMTVLRVRKISIHAMFLTQSLALGFGIIRLCCVDLTMEQLLASACLVEEWGPLFAACGVATVSDLLYVQPSSLGMLGLTLSEAHQLLDVAWSVYAVGGGGGIRGSPDGRQRS